MHNTHLWFKAAFGLALALALASLLLGQGALAQPTYQEPLPTATPRAPLVQHNLISILQGPFETPHEVTRACLSCHADVAQEIMHTTHWTWEYVNETTGQTVGKKTLINNFCISIQSNEPRCTSCHIGYGWANKEFDFSVQENIDCLVCHDTTGEYKKFPTGAGLPAAEPKEFPVGSGNIWSPPDLVKIAQNIGPTSRQTCGVCHFYGGGGDEVKHGDLDSSLVNPPYELDVHMSVTGQNFTCTTCHMTEDHQIVGSRYSMDPAQWKGCESCHGTTPHTLASLNQHTKKVACQSCHIPEYARGGKSTKMTWDWSKAGELIDGKPVVRKDISGYVIYDGQKGEFTLEENVIPEYVWFNGQVEYILAGDEIDPSVTVNINQFLGDKDDPEARIWPVKRFEAVQPYDSGNNTLALPHLFGKDESAYWGNYDWNKAIAFGMEYAGLDYSGEYAFVASQMYWPITHMVAPADQALVCRDCHTTQANRLDFVALGYSEADATRLTNFPPSTMTNLLATTEFDPLVCNECHTNEHTLWSTSSHSTQGVGCVACHKLVGHGEHPIISFTIDPEAETCGACHLKEYSDWQGSRHGELFIACASCHNPHSQQIMLVGSNKTACETCHADKKAEAQHSTHITAGLLCSDCHLNTMLNSGHTFTVNSDTCLVCHGDAIHTSNIMVNANIKVGGLKPIESTAVPAIPPEEALASAAGAGISLPGWLLLLGGVLLGVGLNWLLSTRRLDHSNLPPIESE